MKTFMRVAGVLIALLAIVVISMYFSYGNAEVRLRNQGNAQQSANKISFDNMWKTIEQTAQVPVEYKESFKDALSTIMDKRYKDGRAGALMSWVHEADLHFDSSTFAKLMDIVEENRASWTRDQKKLVDIKREHDNLRTTKPSMWFVGGRPEMKIQIVTSEKTEKAFTTQREDDVNLFNKKK